MNRLKISNKLYGREQEIARLIDSFERISNGQGEVLLVPGHSGAGKTALVQELQKPVLERNGFFVRGKFDQYQQNIPYFSFRQALTELCLELEAEETQIRSRYKENILEAIGNLGQVLVDLVPEFESFLGVQQPLDPISPQEARYRFADVLRKFLNVICLPEHPLVLFIDDWQWADPASLDLLKQLQIGISLRYFLVIVSYRDDEVDLSHPLTAAINNLKRQAVIVEMLQVSNIKLKDVQAILLDTLKPGIIQYGELARMIHQKTGGNPFFIWSFLKFLYEFKLIWFERAENSWKWVITEEGKATLPDNVIELFVMKLRRFNPDSQSLFSLAACLGNRFNVENLSIISSLDREKCMRILSSRQSIDIVQSVPSSKTGFLKKDINTTPGLFIFKHDRLQQAAYTLINKNDLPAIQLKIGRLLLKRLQTDQLNERLFGVLNNLNAGYSLIQENKERLQILELNINAARKAYTATAYRSALQYYQAASRFMNNEGFPEFMWKNAHELGISLYKERAECEFLEGSPLEAEKCIREAFNHSKNAIEKADALNILIVQYTLLSRYPEAIQAGRLALEVLGIKLPKNDYEKASKKEIGMVKKKLGGQNLSILVNQPVMTRPDMLMASKILITMGPPCYRSNQRLWSVLVPKAVNLSLSFGNIPQAGYSHTAFGGLLGWTDNDYSTAKKFAELATLLMTNTFQSPSDQSVFYLMIGSSIRHWFEHLKNGSQDYKKAYEIGLRSGNLQYAAYAFGHNMYCQFYQGLPLDDLIKDTRLSLEFSHTRHNQWAIDLLEGGIYIFKWISNNHFTENGESVWSEENFLKRVDEHHNIQVTCIYKVLKTFSLFVLGKYDEALACSNETKPIVYTVGTQGLLPWAEHVFARVLILAALYHSVEKKQQSQWDQELAQMIEQIRIWAENGKENFEHKYLLASAELARIQNKPTETITLYDQSIKKSLAGNFQQWAGIANERAFSFWLEKGNNRIAQVYWQQAYVCYARWGAHAKISSMESDYRNYLAQQMRFDDQTLKLHQTLNEKTIHDLIDGQINQIRDYASTMQQGKLQMVAKTQTEELAKATQRLRIEIAERKLTEEAMRESEKRFHSIFDNMSEGVALHEMVYKNGKPINYRIVDINPGYIHILGLSREKVIGNLSTKAYEVKDPPFLKEYSEVVETKIPKYFESRFEDLDKYFAISVTPWQENGFATIFSNISERKKIEEEIKLKNEELQKLNMQKDKFFSIIAHDLKSPFNSILGFSQILEEKVQEKDFEDVGKYAKIIQQSSLSTMDLLMNLMEWSQSQTGRMNFNPENFDIVKHIKEIVLLFAFAAEQKLIEIKTNLPSKYIVYADKAMLSTVLRNLISNAIKFSSLNGKILVSIKPEENGLTVTISDNGVGIPKTAIKKLFRIDQNYSTPGTKNEKGTGLGLILCKEFIDKHQGKIWVKSKQGEGSSFFFTIPRKDIIKNERTTTENTPDKKSKITNHGLKILIAENNEHEFLNLSKQLKNLGKDIIHAQTGQQAIELCTGNNDFDLALINMNLPDMNGVLTARKIRKFNKKTVIIAQTNIITDGERQKALDIGCDDLILKPVEKKILLSKIEKLLRK